MKKANFVKDITVIDPNTKGEVDMCLYKHENGGMFAIDFSFLDQVAETDVDENYLIPDPFATGEQEIVVLIHED